VQVKICGITRPEDAYLASSLGADAIGLIFYSGSPRHVSIAMAKDVLSATGPYINVNALFVNAAKSEVESVLSALPISMLQFHGDESAGFCEQFDRPYVKSIAVASHRDFSPVYTQYSGASAFLFDTAVKGAHGGTGIAFDWTIMPLRAPKPRILAGGLTADNIQKAIATACPDAVDVSSGVEASPGVKDAHKLEQFILRAKSAVKENSA
jgi:phosphoribosylanthranilate isomerase|tara:strand:- start:17165 stop:17794 length:630 start_codon:yes stop_codon:yes gene_type:complete